MSDATAVDIPKTAMNQPGHALAVLAEKVSLVEIGTPVEQVLQTRSTLLFMLEQIKSMKAALDAKFIEWIEANGAIQIGTKRIFVGAKKVTKCNDVRQALEAIMDKCGGDWEQFCNCLASDAVKHGAAKIILGKRWDEHFTVTQRMEIREGEEKPIKELVEIDERFLPRPNNAKKGKS